MGRSYLFTGRDTEHLSPAERQLEALYDQIDRPGYRLSPTQFFQLPQAAELMDRLYGGLEDRIPPGSQIVSQTPGKVTYRDAEGYEHNIIRKPDGQFTETSNRPSIVPNAATQGQQQFLQELQGRLQQGFNQPTTLAQLDPETAAALQAIYQAQSGATEQGLADERGRLIAQLYGNRVNQSSIANEAGARFAEGAERLRQQLRADAANRELSARSLLTTLGQQNRELQAGLYGQLTGQGLQRDIAGAGLDLDRARLNESSRQFGASNYLDQLRTQLAQEELDAANSPFNKFLKTLSAAGALAGGVGGLYGAYQYGRRPQQQGG